MRKVIAMNWLSADGFFAGPHGELDWSVPDPEVDRALHSGGHGDTLLMGRVTYDLFESVWPKAAADPQSPPEARRTANELTQMNKVVFSRTRKESTWENTRFVDGDIAEEVIKLKQANGMDILMFGSGTIEQQLTTRGLIDEHFFVVTPVILGAGKQLFKDVPRAKLELVESRQFPSGNILIHYRCA